MASRSAGMCTCKRVDHQIRGVMAVAFHPNGRLGVAYGDGFMRVFAVE